MIFVIANVEILRNRKRLLQKSPVIADLFRDPDFGVLNGIPAQGRNDIPIEFDF